MEQYAAKPCCYLHVLQYSSGALECKHFTSQYITGLVSTCMGDHVVNLPLHFPYLTAIDTNIVMTTMMVTINLLTLINADYAFVVMLDQGRCAWW